MIINIKLSVAKMLWSKTKLIKDNYENRNKLSAPERSMDNIEVYKFDLSHFTIDEMKILRVKISDLVSKSIVDKIDRYIEASEFPDKVLITSLDEFKSSLTAFIKGLKTKWMWRMNEDGFMLPYIAGTVENVPAQKYSPRHIRLKLYYGKIDKGQGELASTSIGFPLTYLSKSEAISQASTTGYFEVDEADLKDEMEVEEELKKSNLKTKKEYLSLRTILLNANIFYNNAKLQNDYVEQYELWQDIQLKKVGHQYTSKNLGYAVTGSYYGWSNVISFIEDKRPCKLVVDEFVLKAEGKGFPITYNSDFGYNYLPYHLYVNLYDITKHRDVKSHVAGLIPYVYNKGLLKELIISESVKRLVNSLIDGEVEMEGKDIIEGKSGGLVILGYGPPGNGKTLTGEIYSEYVEKPLYQIQSSQLGVGISDIENKLSAVLRRAERWNCILMIDEADTYVYKRGADMVQNCIVGTFLRLLEYYNGILFLTTNRKEIIDEAIMSRVTVAIPYNNPDKENLIKIWETHIPSFGVNLPTANLEKIADKYKMSGRDVRNTLKLLSKYYKNGEEITVESIDFVSEYLPSFEGEVVHHKIDMKAMEEKGMLVAPIKRIR